MSSKAGEEGQGMMKTHITTSGKRGEHHKKATKKNRRETARERTKGKHKERQRGRKSKGLLSIEGKQER